MDDGTKVRVGGRGRRRDLLDKLRQQLALTKALADRPFDDPSYENWRVSTAGILAELFGQIESTEHPCVTAFLHYRLPDSFTANRYEMQGYYQNILGYQTQLLEAYLNDFEQAE